VAAGVRHRDLTTHNRQVEAITSKYRTIRFPISQDDNKSDVTKEQDYDFVVIVSLLQLGDIDNENKTSFVPNAHYLQRHATHFPLYNGLSHKFLGCLESVPTLGYLDHSNSSRPPDLFRIATHTSCLGEPCCSPLTSMYIGCCEMVPLTT
jgi:hypothetical protein